MAAEFDGEFQSLAAAISNLRDTYNGVVADGSRKQVEAQHQMSLTMTKALSCLMNLTQLIDGEFKPVPPPPSMENVVKALDASWNDAEKAAEACLDAISAYSVAVTQFHDAQLGGWMDNATQLQTKLTEALNGTNDALKTQQEALQTANQTAMAARSALQEMVDKLEEQKHKYDEADKWTWIWPPARLVLEGLKPVIEALTNSKRDAAEAVEEAEQTASNAQQTVNEAQQKAEQLSSLAEHEAALQAQGTHLMDDCKGLMAQVEQAQTDVARIKTLRYDAWQLAAKCANRAATADYSLTKVDYGTAILEVAAQAAQDTDIKPDIAGIVEHLSQNDDIKGSIRSIVTEDHPEGLLAYVLQLLGESPTVAQAVPTFIRARAAPVRSRHAKFSIFHVIQRAIGNGTGLTEEDKDKIVELVALFGGAGSLVMAEDV